MGRVRGSAQGCGHGGVESMCQLTLRTLFMFFLQIPDLNQPRSPPPCCSIMPGVYFHHCYRIDLIEYPVSKNSLQILS